MTDTAKLFLTDVCHGMRDAVLGAAFIFKVDAEIARLEGEKNRQREEEMLKQRRPIPAKKIQQSDHKVMHKIFQCCALNGGVFWLSLVAFNGAILPLLHFTTGLIVGQDTSHGLIWSWVSWLMSSIFGAFWVLPVFLLSRLVSALWYQDIADAAYRKSRGRPQLPNLSRLIADLLFSVLMQVIFLLQSMLVSKIPISGVGQIISLLHVCLLYSLYAFEYKWFNMGWEVHQRVRYLETNWPYFAGFGLPLAVLTHLPSSFLASGTVFASFFRCL
ncbi:putative etoposide-induced protein 2.4 [Apostichopus japonicus]|uniref:Putative etoposide-induced protein 2.4 n=1 Tax=Stichopus japonicus TaxID=307972 RepID=A0A2G8L307_STIJA|nr:putative etoposide-induced protein 2.4 [Apostichopus japonicus]